MKFLKYSGLVLLALIAACKTKPQHAVQKTEYIQFIHTGADDSTRKAILPLVISTKKVDAPLSRMDSGTVRMVYNQTKAIDPQVKAQFMHSVITDAKTYKTVLDFLNGAGQYYTDDKKINRGDTRDFNVNVEGDTKEIYYRTSGSFFKALSQKLQSEGADKKVIAQVDVLVNTLTDK